MTETAGPPESFIRRNEQMGKIARKYVAEVLQTFPAANQTDLLIRAIAFLLHNIRDEKDAREALESRVRELEENPIKHRGTWREGQLYMKSDFCTFDGSLWRALEANEERPGTNASWVLVLKRGRDGKDSGR